MDADIPILENVPLAPRTTLEVGGPARFYAEPRTPEAVREALAWAHERRIAVMVLGGGSNLLVADRGIAALVLRVHIRGVDVYTLDGATVVMAGAGEPWDALVARAVEHGWAGIECLSGIPGDVGATPIQNVGAYGQEVSDTLLSVRAIDRRTGDDVELTAAECQFAYRDSVFKHALKDRYLITHVAFRLQPGAPPAIRYAELSRALGATPTPTLAATRSTVLALRRSKSMVHDLADENHRSAGSFFTNPIVPEALLRQARESAEAILHPGEKMPEWPAGPGLTKLSAGWLIERSGLTKGTTDGPVGLSTRHALAIVNRGGATASQIVAFATSIKRRVHDRFGITLVPEPVLAGFEPHEVSELLAP